MCVIFKSCFNKDSRSSPESFNGIGLDEGLSILQKVRNKIKVPTQLGIAGIGHANVSDLLTPKLTTINLNQYKMGKLAASKLIERINGKNFKERIFDVGTTLVKGFSL